MSGKRGGISIFLAVTFLSLIVFVMSIVEVTRYQILRVQAERMVISATQSVLAGYDSALKDQYGLFARDPQYGDVPFVMPESGAMSSMNRDFTYYLNQNISQTPEDLHMSLVDQYVFRYGDKAYTSLVPFKVANSDFSVTEKLADPEGGGLAYVKEDMVNYMELRLPLVGITTILDTFGAAEKLGKTTELVESKNAQIEKAGSIEALYTDLYYHLDGATPDKEGQTITVSDTHYVNRLDKGDGAFTYPYDPSIVVGLVPNPDQPIEALRRIQANIGSWEYGTSGLGDFLEAYEKIEGKIKAQEKSIDQDEESIKNKKDAITTKETSITLKETAIKAFEATNVNGMFDDSIAALKGDISDLKTDIIELESKIKDLEADIKSSESKIKGLKQDAQSYETRITDKMIAIGTTYGILENDIPMIRGLTIGDQSYLSHNLLAGDLITDIQKAAEDLGQSLDQVIEEAQGNRETYIGATADQTVSEMEALKDNYGLTNENQHTNKATKSGANIAIIHEAVTHNSEILTDAATSVEWLVDNYQGLLITELIDEGVTERDAMVRLVEISGQSVLYDSYLRTPKWAIIHEADSAESFVEDVYEVVEDYQLATLLDYSGFDGGAIDSEKEGSKHYFAQLKTLYEELKTLDFLSPEGMEAMTLPDGVFTEAFNVADVISTTDDIATMTDIKEDHYKGEGSPDDDAVFMESGRSAAADTSTIKNVKDLLLINEYAVGMFKAYPDKKDGSRETLAGYSKGERVYPTELEYIYTGMTDSSAALRKVGTQIFGVRTAFNIVHLATNGAKRAMIMKVASAIAGPIGFGILTILMALLVTLLWAVVESFADLDKLLSGEKVPLLKTRATWFTSLEGMVGLAADKIGDVAVKATSKVIDEVSDVSKDKIQSIEDSLTDQGQQIVKDQLDHYYEQADVLVYGIVEEFEQIYHEAMDQVVLSYRDGKQKVDPTEYLTDTNSVMYEIMAQSMASLYEALDDSVETGYVELMAIKEKVIRDYENAYDEVKEKLQKDVLEAMSESIEKTFETIDEELDGMTDKAKEASAEIIRQKLESATKSLKDKASQVKVKVPEGKSKLDYEMLIPAIDYQMYIRMFMLADGKSLDDRVVRMLDLIDYNLAVQRYGQEQAAEMRSLYDYAIEVNGVAEIEANYLFLDLPVKGMKHLLSDDFYSLRVRAVNGYE